jgi:hypothetical protein
MIETYLGVNKYELAVDRLVITSPAEEKSIFLSKASNRIKVTNNLGKILYKEILNGDK